MFDNVKWDELLDDEATFFRALVETIPQMVWSKDAAGRNEYCNARFLNYLQCSVDEFINDSWQMVHPDDVEPASSAWNVAFTAGTPYQAELRLRPKTSLAYRWFLLRCIPYRDARGVIIKWFGTTTDVDEQKRFAQQQETIASALSEMFVPSALPALAEVAFDAVYRPAEDVCKVGGDFYEALVLPDGRLLLAIGDVAGHGLPAAVTMGRIRHAIVGAAFDTHCPGEILAKVNRIHCLSGETMVTAIVGFLDVTDGRFIYASAGHPNPIVARPDGTAWMLPAGNVPLGILPDARFATHAGRLDPGMMLVLYTDGITELGRDVIEGERRLHAALGDCLLGNPARPAHWLQTQLLGDQCAAIDDIAILTAAYHGAAGASGAIKAS